VGAGEATLAHRPAPRAPQATRCSPSGGAGCGKPVCEPPWTPVLPAAAAGKLAVAGRVQAGWSGGDIDASPPGRMRGRDM
jgi:hypothetical protein